MPPDPQPILDNLAAELVLEVALRTGLTEAFNASDRSVGANCAFCFESVRLASRGSLQHGAGTFHASRHAGVEFAAGLCRSNPCSMSRSGTMLPFRTRFSALPREKSQIAVAAAQLVKPGDTVALSG